MSKADNPRAVIGSNSEAAGHLKAFVERIERLEEEKKSYADDIKEVYAEAKANGFDTKALRAVVRLRAKDPEEVKEFNAIVDTYAHALGLEFLL